MSSRQTRRANTCLTTQNLRFVHVDFTFFIAGLVVIVGIIIAYIAIKKRYWFW